MGNLSHTVGGTDNLVSFKSAARVPIDSLKVYFKPIQDGEGDPSPENVRPIKGWNEVEAYRVPEVMPFKVIQTSETSLGVDFACDTNGVITANGTPTSWSQFRPIEVEVLGSEILYQKILGNMQNVTFARPYLYDKDGIEIKVSLADNILEKGLDLRQYESVAKVRVGLKRASNNVPMMGSCFIAITNGAIASSTTFPVTFPVTGKNKFNGEISNANIASNGQISSNVKSRISTSLISIAHGQYTLSSSENHPVSIYAYDDNGFIANESLVSWQESPTTFVVENAKYVRFKWKKTDDSAFDPSEITNIQLERGSEATAYEQYNPDNTFYGGYVDLVKGEVISGWTAKKIKDIDWTYNTSQRRFQYAFPQTDLMGSSADIQWSNCAIAEAYTTSTMNGYQNLQIATWKNTYIYIRDERFNSVEEFIAAMGDTYISYPIVNKSTYPLIANQLKTFLNNNAFWSNTNDVTEVSYAVHDAAPIRAARKRIMAASPNLETLSSDLVTFNTDVAAPLKECKVYFEPVQEGEGDPSPENIRPIGGWNNIEVTKCGKNLFDISEMASRTGVTVDGDTFVGTARNIGALGNYSYGYNIKRTTLHIPSNISINVSCMTYSEGNISTNGAGFSLNFFNENGTMLRPWYTYNSTLSSSLHNGMITPVDDVIYYVFGWYNNADNIWHVSNMQFEIGSSMTEYESYNGTTIPITFPSEAGAIYGGYVDLVKGEIVEEYALFEKTWGELTLRGTLSNTDYKSMDLDKDIYESSEYSYVSKLSNIVPYSYSWTENDSPHFYVSNSRRIYVWLPIGTEASTTIQIIGHLKEPIHYPIDSQTLKTLRGTNNIWSTSNGPISIKYWKH